jgi:uncharacterized damage-inducible protein DinB
MSDDELEQLRYPLGRFSAQPHLAPPARTLLMEQLEGVASRVRAAVTGLEAEELERPYRPGGWTIRQVVHHLADSHMMACTRFRRALTEEEPAVATYDESAWARLPDAGSGDVEPSLLILEGVHQRWGLLLRGMDDAAFGRAYRHPELGRVPLDRALQLYAWHGRHHVAHILTALAGMRRVPAL